MSDETMNDIDQDESDSVVPAPDGRTEGSDPDELAGGLDARVAGPHAERDPYCEFRTGRAGTGKSYSIVEQANADAEWGIVTATTGIAAVNLGSVTINAVLRYFDTASLRDQFMCGNLTRRIHELAKSYRNIVIDEGSMCDGDQLDILFRGCAEANRYNDIEVPIGLVLVGDFAQLPPIKGRWAFEANCWERFAEHTTRLTKVWRQDAGVFLDALNYAREGNGGACLDTLNGTGFPFSSARDPRFDGTTILAKNDLVARHNQLALDWVKGKAFTIESSRWGQQRSEWGENRRTHEWGIPVEATFKIGAYVMILANRPDFSVVNGDCGHIRDVGMVRDEVTWIDVEVIRTGRVERITKIVRGVEHTEKPDGYAGTEKVDGGYYARQHFNRRARRWVTGQVEWMPIRLAYASTVHKAQGLTLDRVQVDLRDRFFSSAAMAYVAMSRCRTLDGLRIVCAKEHFAGQIKSDPKVGPWL